MRKKLGLAFVLVVAGCGDNSGLPPGSDLSGLVDMNAGADLSVGDMGPPVDLEKVVSFAMFAVDYAKTRCSRYMACGQLDQAQFDLCVERQTKHTGWDQDLEIMKGRMQINEAACLQSILNLRCDNSNSDEVPASCVTFIYTPHQLDGATCLSSKECTGGHCQHSTTDAGTSTQPTGCAGVCAPTSLKVGDPCTPGSSDCPAGSYCDGGTSQCVKSAQSGELCYAFGSPTPDPTKPQCAYPLYCPTFGTAPTCTQATTQKTLHGACDPFQGVTQTVPPCDTGMYCQVQYTDGAACDSVTPCVGGYACSAPTNGRCQVPSGGKCETKLTAGTACDPKNEYRWGLAGLGKGGFQVDNQCEDASYCYQLPTDAAPKCQALGAANGDCVTYSASLDSCKQALYCDATTKKCLPWIADSMTCTTNNRCAGASITQQFVCIADNSDAGSHLTCEQFKDYGANCDPLFQQSLCYPTDFVAGGSTYCAASPAGSGGTCQPKCF
jgi:hypothetical protein